jgi:hypothetical protein
MPRQAPSPHICIIMRRQMAAQNSIKRCAVTRLQSPGKGIQDTSTRLQTSQHSTKVLIVSVASLLLVGNPSLRWLVLSLQPKAKPNATAAPLPFTHLPSRAQTPSQPGLRSIRGHNIKAPTYIKDLWINLENH